MPKKCVKYFLISPLRASYADRADSKVLTEMHIRFNSGTHQFSILPDADGEPAAARLILDGLTEAELEEEKLPSRYLPLLQWLKEHLRTILRLTHHPEAAVENLDLLVFPKDDSKSGNYLSMEVKQTFSKVPFSAVAFKDSFGSSLNHREELRMFVDGQDARIPLQYRFLSLYRLVELHFKKNGAWKTKELNEFLQPYSSMISKHGTQTPAAYLHKLRDMCAHVSTGRRKIVLGVTHLNHSRAVEVEKILPALVKIGEDIINLRADGKFTVGALGS